MLLYLNQEGRGIGLGQQDPRLRAAGRGARHRRGQRAARLQGRPARLRHRRPDPARPRRPHDAAAEQQPAQVRRHRGLRAVGHRVAAARDRRPSESTRRYLKTKKEKLGHKLSDGLTVVPETTVSIKRFVPSATRPDGCTVYSGLRAIALGASSRGLDTHAVDAVFSHAASEGSVMFDSLSTASRTSSDRCAAERLTERRRGGAARDPAGAARGRRQLQGRQGVHRSRARPGDRTRTCCASLSPAQQVVKIVRDEMLALFGDAQGGLPPTGARPARHPAARPAGRGQDDDGRQAGAVADQARAASAARVDRRASARRRSSS